MKKFMKLAVMAAFALVTVYNVHKVQTEVVLSDAQLKNVEALASGEESELSKDCGGCSTAYTYDCCTLITEIGTFYLKKL